LNLLGQRAALALEIGSIKAKMGLPIHDPAREEQVLDQLSKKVVEPLSGECIRAIYTQIMRETRRLEHLNTPEAH